MNQENVTTVYSSNYVRAMQTAKYFVENHNLKLNIDERLNERTKGIVESTENPKFFCEQYWNKFAKAEEGESQFEVNERMSEAFWEIVNKNRNKRNIIVSHGTSISFLLMNWCKLLDVQANFLRKLEFNGKIIINRPYKAPEVFKVLVDSENNIVDIENLDFEDLK